MRYLDMLAKLGVGSAHPGGFSATINLLESTPIAKESRILEVGCGTGRTACYLAGLGYDVTAVDIRSDMLEKASFRAKMENVKVRFLEGSVESLPLENDTFDIIIAESVTIFADTKRALAEYYRILCPGGRLLDRELFTIKLVTPEFAERINEYYGVEHVWSAEQWKQLLTNAGFHHIQLVQPGAFTDINWNDEMNYPDMSGVVDPAVFSDQRIWELTRQYDELMMKFGDHFGYGVWMAFKGEKNSEKD